MNLKPIVLFLAAAVSLTFGSAAAAQTPVEIDALDRFRLQLDFHPIGKNLPAGKFRYNNLLRPHPAGFRADSFSMYFAPTYGVTERLEVSLGVTGAERIGPGGEALFYGGGAQYQIARERRGMPAVAAGFTAMTGPHDHNDGSLYLAATRTVRRRESSGLFLHGGVKLNAYESDDYGSSAGVRPYGAVTAVLNRRVTVSGEIAPPQPWEKAVKYAVRATVMIGKNYGLSGGIRGNGYRTSPFLGLSLGGAD